MMREPGLYAWRNPWWRWSVLFVCGTAVVSVLVGFIWLPSVQGDFSAQGLWASICRAAGVPDQWGDPQAASTRGVRSTDVVLSQDMARPGSSEAVGRGATLALQCTICHGARGVSETDAPNLAGQYPDVVIKQLADYRSGDRTSSIMQALAKALSDRDVRDLAAYYAYLPRPTLASADHRIAVPALVRVGDPMRNIAPCASCHGGIDHKLGAPWLEGMPAEYIQAQLSGFKSGQRKNDSSGQMRNMARTLLPAEIEAMASFYSGRGNVR
jgi:cytochrome c553